ncbi:glycosyltransferase family 2 protein [Flavitalea flava]
MLISILIANFNNSRFLGIALDSVLCQTYQDWEVILVDDGSTDEFERVATKFGDDPRIKIFRNEKNQGCGFTKRRCTGLATGSILAFLDPDDSLDREALRIMERAHRENPNCSLIHSTHYICDRSLMVIRMAGYPRALPTGIPYLLLSDGRIHHFATFKKSAYVLTGGISPLNKKAVDQDLYYQLEETGAVLFIDMPLYNYRIHEGAISNAGKEAEATLWHYAVIRDACLRRIGKLRKVRGKDHAAPTWLTMGREPAYWIKRYRTRYYKIQVFLNFRKKDWAGFIRYLILFSIMGGMNNLMGYIRKFPKEGISLIRRSFVDNYEIK